MRAVLTVERIQFLLLPYLTWAPEIPPKLYEQLAQYLELLLRWNARTNLTAVREPEEMVRRHFGESLFAGQHLGKCETLLDFGSGAGFPGLPIQMLRPGLRVTLAESQNKKATFLREVVRTLALGTEVWAGRVEAMPAEIRFDVVAMRAVDHMQQALEAAAMKADLRVVVLSGQDQSWTPPAGFAVEGRIAMAQSETSQVVVLKRRYEFGSEANVIGEVR